MTFTVDDLVASFNAGGHIGQEAIDIANLQAQLAQTLAYAQQQQQQQQQQFASSSHRLCNTPTTARTPTTSLGNWSAFEQQHHRARSRSASVVAEGGGMDTVTEDSEMEVEMDADEELAVEQLLVPPHSQAQTSVRRRTRGDSIFAQQQNYVPHTQSHSSQIPVRYSQTGADPASVSDSVSPVSSSYAASDPFFSAAAAESARQNQQSQSSFFAQIGRPSQHSPFFAAAQANSGSATPQNQFNASPWCVPAGTVDS
ncbi:hypothetical protein A7U60_g8508 [Sanghuangporus baumii]|uniref:Uncharacterized protein n=1 Tax=Sanghuangporus baumii TaxID=108892 RepID=A0A9Q5HR90_SANBA|nr:hypothetical protein A7U60_g8508 [Sanghuangporus baumii]